MSKEAMTLALEALESLKVTVSSRTEANVIDGVDLFPTQIAALRKALANEALDKMAENARQVGLDYEPSSVSKLAREAGIRDCTCNGALGCLERFASLVRADERARMAEQPAPATQLQEQEPVAWMYPDDYERMSTSETFCTVYSVEVGSATRGESTVALYTSPPAQRTWVGLTDEEMRLIDPDGFEDNLPQMIQQALKEKNT